MSCKIKIILIIIASSICAYNTYSDPLGVFMVFYRQQIEETDFGFYADHRIYTDYVKLCGQQSFIGCNWNATKFLSLTLAPGIEYYDKVQWKSVFLSTGWFITDKWNLFTEHLWYYNDVDEYYNFIVTNYKFYKNIGFGLQCYQGSGDLLKGGFQFDLSAKNSPLFMQLGWIFDINNKSDGLLVMLGYFIQ